MLGFFGSFLKALQCHFVFTQINSTVFFKFIRKKRNQPVVKIITTKKSVSICSFNIKHTFSDFQNGNIKRTATQVKYCNFFIMLFVKTICHSCRSGFVYDSKHFQSSYLACILGSLSLGVAEISRYCNNSFLYGFTQIFLNSLFHFLKNGSRNFLRCIVFSIYFYAG